MQFKMLYLHPEDDIVFIQITHVIILLFQILKQKCGKTYLFKLSCLKFASLAKCFLFQIQTQELIVLIKRQIFYQLKYKAKH